MLGIDLSVELGGGRICRSRDGCKGEEESEGSSSSSGGGRTRTRKDVDEQLAVLGLTASALLFARHLGGESNFLEALQLFKLVVGMQGGPVRMLG